VIDSFLCSQTYTTQKAKTQTNQKNCIKENKSFTELILELSAQTRRGRRRRRRRRAKASRTLITRRRSMSEGERLEQRIL
jgi:hypothetical protein